MFKIFGTPNLIKASVPTWQDSVIFTLVTNFGPPLHTKMPAAGCGSAAAAAATKGCAKQGIASLGC